MALVLRASLEQMKCNEMRRNFRTQHVAGEVDNEGDGTSRE